MNRNEPFRISLLYFVLVSAFLLMSARKPAFSADSEPPQNQTQETWSSRLLKFFAGEPARNSPRLQTESDPKTQDQVLAKDSGLAVQVISSRLPSAKENLRNMTTNVSYKSQKDLERLHPLSFQDAVKDLESVILYDEVGNDIDKTFSLRGFEKNGRTAFIVDGVKVNEADGEVVNFPLLHMRDLESIQINRGPTSSIYGSNFFAGAVILSTRKPSPKKISTFGGFEITSFRGLNFYEGVSGTLNDRVTPLEGKLTYYFEGGRDRSKGFNPRSDYRIGSFNSKISYALPEHNFEINVGVKHLNDVVSNTGSITFDEYQRDQFQSIKPNDGRLMKQTITQIGIDKKFFDEKLTASLLSFWRSNEIRFDTTSNQFVDPDNSPDLNRVFDDSLSTNLSWQLMYQDRWDWFSNETLLGMELRDAQSESTRIDVKGGQKIDNRGYETFRTADPRGAGFFWNEKVGFNDRLFLHYGMRHDFASLTTHNHLNAGNDISRDWKSSTLSTGLVVKPFLWMDVFGNYSQGFRVPDISEIAPYSNSSLVLSPERADSYEVGYRSQYRSEAAFKQSFFLIDTKDEILYDPQAITLGFEGGQNKNVGKSRRLGLESRLDLTPIKELDVYGAHTWTQAWIRESAQVSDLSFTNVLLDDRSIGLVPEHRYTMGVQLKPFASTQSEMLEGVSFGLDGVFVGRQHPSGYESNTQDVLNATGGAGHWIKPYSVWNFNLTYQWRGYQVYFKVLNLFNERYYSRSLNSTRYDAAFAVIDTRNYVNPGAPREYVGGMKWEF